MNRIYTLAQAMTIYKSEYDHFFQIHDVFESKKGEAILGAGKPLTREALEVICKGVLPTMMGNLSFLNGRILGSSGTIHGPDIWWSPPVSRPMFFTDQIKIKNGLAPWPGLVFVTRNEDLSMLFAVKGDQRPTLETELYVAPFFNMTGDDLCLGSARHPSKNNAYDEWEAAVYTSAFSEERLNEQRIAGAETLSHFWMERIGKGERIFPEGRLIPSRSSKTIKHLIESLKKGKETS